MPTAAPNSASPNSFAASAPAIASRGGEDEEEEDEGKREAVVEAGLEVERVADRAWEPVAR